MRLLLRYHRDTNVNRRVKCEEDDIVYDVADKLLPFSQRFICSTHLDVDDVQVFRVEQGGGREEIDHGVLVTDLMKSNPSLMFDIGIPLYVRSLDAVNPKKVICKRSDKVCDLTDEIKAQAAKFGITEEDRGLLDKKYDIVIRKYTRGQVSDAEELDPLTDLNSIGDEQLTFEIISVDTSPKGIPLYINYVGALNPKRMLCKLSDKVCDLADEIKAQSLNFGIPEEDRRLLEKDCDIIIRQRGVAEALDPLTDISSISDKKFTFEIIPVVEVHKGLVIYVRSYDKAIFDMKECRLNDRIGDLRRMIEKDKKIEDGKDVLVYKPVAVDGYESPPLDTHVELDNKAQYIYQIPNNINYDKIRDYSVQQNIVFMGAPGHGKSSTINSLAKALGYRTSIAQTYTAATAGSRLYEPHAMQINGEGERLFRLFDVPGASLRAIPEKKMDEVMSSVFLGYQPPFKDLGNAMRWFASEKEKIHAVVCVQSCMADTDVMLTKVVSAAKKEGINIPAFMILTHIDLMEAEDFTKKKKDISMEFGLDTSFIFQIANYDRDLGMHNFREDTDGPREYYLRNILEKMLFSSRYHKQK